jgi:thiamine-monophosphate kinase
VTVVIPELADWLGDQPRSPLQTHAPGDSDAEVIRLRDDLFLATSSDAIEEEIAAGLYRQPRTAGWVAVMAGLSDLAAVGAAPLGILLTTIWAADWGLSRRAELAAGVAEALRRSGTALLGGDNASGQSTVVAISAIGSSPVLPMSRRGARPGDVLCVTGSTGRGAALGASLVLREHGFDWPEDLYRPCARLEEGARLRPFASACVDASDGILRAVRALTSANGVGAALTWNPDSLDGEAAAYFRRADLPLWWLWLAEHADFELVAAVPKRMWSQASAAVKPLHVIGEVVGEPNVTVTVDGRTTPLELDDLPTFSGLPPDDQLELYAQANATIVAQQLP